jgi:FAD:protein FMN transferase
MWGGSDMWRAVVATFLALAISVCVGQVVFGQGLVRVQIPKTMLNTNVTITVYAKDKDSGKEAIDKAYAKIQSLEEAISRHLPESDISRVNRDAGDKPVQVSPETFDLIQRNKEFGALTEGAFDITVTPLIQLWQAAGRKGVLPRDEERAAARALVGYDKLLLDPANRTVKFAKKGMAIDLGGNGKGYAADLAAKVLKAEGITSALVACGGDMAAVGRKPNGQKWQIGIQDPTKPESPLNTIQGWNLELENESVSTSGNYQRFVVIQGQRYSHILDPSTGMPADAVPSVTVIAANTTLTDTLDTAFSVLGIEKSMKLAEKLKAQGVETMMVTIKDGELQFHPSPGFEKHVAK